jgi:uncharacterized protein YgiM (DUF1202 family)
MQRQTPAYLAVAGGLALALGVAVYAFRGSFFPSVKIAELIDRNYPVAHTADAFDAPETDAKSVVRLNQGAEVLVIGTVEGGSWYQIELPDKSLAYVPISEIGAPDSGNPSTATLPTPPPTTTTDTATTQTQTMDSSRTIQFAAASDVLTVLRTTSVYLGPNIQAPAAETLDAGTKVQVIAKSTDGLWAWVQTADDHPAYIAMSDLGPG